ncbi:MAG TPA: hypothetical protein G4N94_01225 [Caldilineae bacterium]|nr:hypothetical protein [Caldilineae bacterium]
MNLRLGFGNFLRVVLIFIFLSFMFLPQTKANTHYILDTVEPNTDDWPQKFNDQVNGSWCGAASLQAKIHWDWNHHRTGQIGQNHFFAQDDLWNFARDHTCSDISTKGVRGHDRALPGTVGNGWHQVRKLNISHDFGLDPHAIAWTLWDYGPWYYHNWIYYNSSDSATKALLWTLEEYQEPVVVAVNHGAQLVLVIGYEADEKANNSQSGAGTIYQIRYADPLYDTGYAAYHWVSYDTWRNTHFTRYTHVNDPDPSTSAYIPPPDHWRNHWVTIERDNFTVSPDLAYTVNPHTGDVEMIPPHWRDCQPLLKYCSP